MRLFFALVFAATAISISCAATNSIAAPEATPDGIRFAFAHPDARFVSLAGSFNQWSTSSHPMTRAGSAANWTVVVALPRGEHLFMYVVDGSQWITPPLADDYVDDGFGARNGVVVVRPNER